MATLSVSEPARGVPEIWWLNPARLGFFFLIPLYVIIFLIPEVFGPYTVRIKFQVFFTWKYFLLGLLYLFVLIDAALLASLAFRGQAGERPVAPSFQRYYLDVLALLTIAAYLIWFRKVFMDPHVMLALITGQPGVAGMIRTGTKTIGGVTTLTQLGVAYAVLYLHQVWASRTPFPFWRYTGYFYAIVGFTLFRMYAWSERLAFIELMLPIAVLYIAYRVPRNAFTRVGLFCLPFAGVLGLIGLFGVTEYFRSWSTHYQYQNIGFWTFVCRRLMSYYYTALNNGAGLLTVGDWPTWTLDHVLAWLYRFPMKIGAIILFVSDPRPTKDFLTTYADPEFNNLSGIFTVFLDIGVPLAVCHAAIVGAVLGFCWRGLRRGVGIGMILYPVLFVGLLEVFRILYLGEPRSFPTLVALIAAYMLFRDQSGKRSSEKVLPAPRPRGALS
jgi:hypothetical protein